MCVCVCVGRALTPHRTLTEPLTEPTTEPLTEPHKNQVTQSTGVVFVLNNFPQLRAHKIHARTNNINTFVG